MTHLQNLASPQQGNWTITAYMQDAKYNIDTLALMNVPIDFDELSISVFNGLARPTQTYLMPYKLGQLQLLLRNCLSNYLVMMPN